MNRTERNSSNPAAPITARINNASSPARHDLHLGALEHWLATITARATVEKSKFQIKSALFGGRFFYTQAFL